MITMDILGKSGTMPLVHFPSSGHFLGAMASMHLRGHGARTAYSRMRISTSNDYELRIVE